MKTIEIESLPCVKFAHIYNADTYLNKLDKDEDGIEVSYIADGSLEIIFCGNKYVAKKGDIICLPYLDEPTIVRTQSFHEHHTVFAGLKWRFVNNHINGLYLPLITPSSLNLKSAESIIELLVCNQLLFKDSPTKGATLFLNLLYEIDQCNRKEKKMNLPSEVQYTQRAKEYIQKNIHLPIQQKMVAEHLSISPEYLCYIFKKTEGITLIKYCNMEKLLAMKALMEKENIELNVAAGLYGYNDPNYVSRLFKKIFGFNITEKGNYCEF